jgi:hypothetical protein
MSLKQIFNIVITSLVGFFVIEFIKKQKIRNIPITDKSSPNYPVYIKNVTEALYNAMNKVGTDEERIFAIFDNLDTETYQDVKKEFGKRGYNNLGGIASDSGLKLDLTDWLERELSKKDFDKIMTKIQ